MLKTVREDGPNTINRITNNTISKYTAVLATTPYLFYDQCRNYILFILKNKEYFMYDNPGLLLLNITYRDRVLKTSKK